MMYGAVVMHFSAWSAVY